MVWEMMKKRPPNPRMVLMEEKAAGVELVKLIHQEHDGMGFVRPAHGAERRWHPQREDGRGARVAVLSLVTMPGIARNTEKSVSLRKSPGRPRGRSKAKVRSSMTDT